MLGLKNLVLRRYAKMKQPGRFLLIVFLWCFSPPVLAAESQLTPEEQAYVDRVDQVWGTVETQQGEIRLAGDVAKLDIPESFYYLNGRTRPVPVSIPWDC